MADLYETFLPSFPKSKEELLKKSIDDLRRMFVKGSAIMMELQVLVNTPNHMLEVGFMENLHQPPDPEIL